MNHGTVCQSRGALVISKFSSGCVQEIGMGGNLLITRDLTDFSGGSNKMPDILIWTIISSDSGNDSLNGAD